MNNEAKRVFNVYVRYIKNCLDNRKSTSDVFQMPFNVKFNVTFDLDHPTFVSGTYNQLDDIMTINTTIGHNFSKESFNELLELAYTSIVHELEHRAQHGKFGERYAKDRALVSPKWQTQNSNPLYSLKPIEIEAQVVGLKKRAQLTKQRLQDVINSFVDALEKSGRVNSINAAKVRKKMLTYAMARYPKAFE